MASPRAALYVRVSSEEQRHGYSLDAQEKDLRDYATRHGYQVVRILREVGSGRDPNRPKIQALLKQAEQRRFDVLVTWRRDRFGRSTVNNELMQRFLRGFDVRVESMMMGPQQSNASTRLTDRLMDAVAEFESESISERSYAGKLEAARTGHYPGKPPTGWTRLYPSMEIIIDEGIVDSIRQRFERAAAGWTVRRIADASGLQDHTSTMRMLRNPVYKGEGTWCGIPVALPAIVSTELWEAANRCLEAKKRNRATTAHAGQGKMKPSPGSRPRRARSLQTRPAARSS